MPPNYRVLVQYEPDRSVFVARAPELEHCSAEGATRAEAIAGVEDEIAAQLANIAEHGAAPPAALDEGEAPSGELALKLSRSLYRELAWQARLEGIGLDQLAGELLAAGIEVRRGRRRQAGAAHDASAREERGDGGPNARRDDRGRDVGRRGGYGSGGRYHAIMEDRATFLEYVRQLEQGGAPAAGHGGGRRPGRGRGFGNHGGDRGGQPGGSGTGGPSGGEGGDGTAGS